MYFGHHFGLGFNERAFPFSPEFRPFADARFECVFIFSLHFERWIQVALRSECIPHFPQPLEIFLNPLDLFGVDHVTSVFIETAVDFLLSRQLDLLILNFLEKAHDAEHEVPDVFEEDPLRLGVLS